MKFAFIAKHRAIWPVMRLCKTLDVSRSGFHAWLIRMPAKRTLDNEELTRVVRQSFITSDRTYEARRVWHNVLAEGFNFGPHRIEQLTRAHGLKARPRRRYLPPDALLHHLDQGSQGRFKRSSQHSKIGDCNDSSQTRFGYEHS